MTAMYLLDTNVISLLDPRRLTSARDLVAWIRRNGERVYLSAVTLMELEAGILKLRRDPAKAARAAEYEVLRRSIEGDFSHRILSFDVAVALATARLADAIRPAVIELKDLIVAATARTHGLTVLTRNLRHFTPTGVRAIDPLAGLPRTPHPRGAAGADAYPLGNSSPISR